MIRLKKEASNGLNVIDDLDARAPAQPTGIIHRASSMKIANRDKTAIGTRWMSKRRDLVFVNNDDGAIGEFWQPKLEIHYKLSNRLLIYHCSPH